MIISLYLVQFKYAKIHKKEIPSTCRIVLEFFCVPLYIEFLSDLYKKKKSQVASTYDTNVECQIRRFCCNLFWSYAVNSHTHTHKPKAKNLIFGFRDLKTYTLLKKRNENSSTLTHFL